MVAGELRLKAGLLLVVSQVEGDVSAIWDWDVWWNLRREMYARE